MINFHDFANKYGWSTLSNGEQDADYMWKKYDRAGFVEAIRVADTLYILRDEFKNLPNEKINFADLNKAEEYLKMNLFHTNISYLVITISM